MFRRCRLSTIGAVAVLATAILAQGCGLKADPAPRRLTPLIPVTDIRLQAVSGGIFIQWRNPQQPRPMTRFHILRSEVGADGQSCPGCPPDEVKVADLAAGEVRRAVTESDTAGYQDATVRPGSLYRYRVVGCDRDGFCSEASAPAQLGAPAADGSR